MRHIQTVLKATEHKTGHNCIIQPPLQWTGGSIQRICEVCHQKCFDNKNHVNLDVLQIRLTLIGTRLPSPATPLLNRHIGALLPQMNREPFNINADNDYYEVLKVHQDRYLKGSDTHKDLLSFPIGSTVAVQCKDGGVIKEANSTDYNGQSYIIRVGKSLADEVQQRLICRTLITREQYL